MTSWADLAGGLQAIGTRTFAHNSPIVFTPQLDAPVAFNDPANGDAGPFAIFDGAYQVVELGETDVPIDSTAPALTVRLSDFPTPPKQDDTAVIDGTSYRAVSIQPDGQGGAVIVLRKI
jgi:hypothetical protein